MVAVRAVAAVFAAAAAMGVGSAAAQVCKNHYILAEPCSSGWRPAGEGVADLDVQVLAIDPSDPAKLYAGGRAGLFGSSNGARTWEALPLALEPYSVEPSNTPYMRSPGFVAGHVVKVITVDPAQPQTLYVATHWTGGCLWFQSRFFKSVDGGLTWSANVSSGIGGCERITAVVPDTTRAGFFYFSHFDYSMADTYAPFRTSADGFESSQYYLQPLVPVLAADPRRTGTVYGGTLALDWDYYGLFPPGVLKSEDSGQTWFSTGLVGRGVSAIATGGDPVTVYAATFNQAWYWKPELMEGIHRSHDGGRTWVAGRGLDAIVGTDSRVIALVVHPDEPSSSTRPRPVRGSGAAPTAA
jgi:hypothetical protein